MLCDFAKLGAILLAVTATACGDGSLPNDEGPGDGSGDGSGDNSGDGDASGRIQSEPVALMGTAPDLLLVVDRSQSMDEPLTSPLERKWPIMRDALDEIVAEKSATIRFGLMLYPSSALCVAGQMDVAPDVATDGEISNRLAVTSPGGATPTHTTLQAARAYYDNTPENAAGRFVLLATDGMPNCNPTFQDDSIEESVAAAQALSAQGIDTFVLGFGATINADPETLTRLAQAGGTNDYYSATSPEELASALGAIAGTVGAASCLFELDQVPELDRMQVSLDGQSIEPGPDGYTYDETDNSVMLLGQSCDALKSGQIEQVTVDYGCFEPECDQDDDCASGEFCEGGVCRRPID